MPRGRPKKSKQDKPDKPLSAMRLDELLAKAQKKYGSRLARAAEVEHLYKVSYAPVGIPLVDEMLGGGLPRGHISEVFGPPSAGKSWFLLNAVAAAQQRGELTAWIDAEVTFYPELARAVGVDMDELLLSTPECGEDALDLILTLVKAKKNLGIIVLDSATALVSRDELDRPPEIGSMVAPTVRLWNAGLIRLKSALFGTPTAFAFVNQVRDNVGVMYGPATTEPLGWRSKHDSVLRLNVRRKEWIKQGDKRTGQVNMARVEKMKYDGGPPIGTEVTFDINFKDLRIGGTDEVPTSSDGGASPQGA